MIYNDNGVIINEGYQLDLIINEGFNDIANKGLKTVHGWIRKIIDAVQSTIEYGSRIKYSDIIKNISNLGGESFNYQLNKGIARLYPYLESEGYGKWIDNFNKALNELKRDHTVSTEFINKILYEGKDKNEWFKNLSKNYNASGKNPNSNELKKIVTNLQDFTKPLRKSYSELKILNTNINKGMRINSEVMAIMHSYCINAISAYRNMSMVLIEIFRNNNHDQFKNAEANIEKTKHEFEEQRKSFNKEINDTREKQYQSAKNISQRHKEMYDEIEKMRKTIQANEDDFEAKIEDIDALLKDL